MLQKHFLIWIHKLFYNKQVINMRLVKMEIYCDSVWTFYFLVSEAALSHEILFFSVNLSFFLFPKPRYVPLDPIHSSYRSCGY